MAARTNVLVAIRSANRSSSVGAIATTTLPIRSAVTSPVLPAVPPYGAPVSARTSRTSALCARSSVVRPAGARPRRGTAGISTRAPGTSAPPTACAAEPGSAAARTPAGTVKPAGNAAGEAVSAGDRTTISTAASTFVRGVEGGSPRATRENRSTFAVPGGISRSHDVTNGSAPLPERATASPGSPATTDHERTGSSTSPAYAWSQSATVRPRRTSSVVIGAPTGRSVTIPRPGETGGGPTMRRVAPGASGRSRNSGGDGRI